MRRHRAPATPSPVGASRELELGPITLGATTARAALDHAQTYARRARLEADGDLARLAEIRTASASLASRTYAASMRAGQFQETALS